jgi:lipopolysaccharide/colanic/teichoic acid biosynthesis glycosyltransferase
VHGATYPDADFDRLVAERLGTPRSRHPIDADEYVAVRSHGYPLKRALDIVGALVALVLLSPLMLLVALAIKLTSRGPVIFRQPRVGQGGTLFTMYKFRSMRTDMDDRAHREFVAKLIDGAKPADEASAQAGAFKMKADPRITSIGRFIRKTSIDELPQFYNVLKGDMSLVGPRPPVPYEAERYKSWHLRRVFELKPGLTGIWQVEGRSRVSFDEMVRMDLRYLRHCSLTFDLGILLRTVRVVLTCEGAQ